MQATYVRTGPLWHIEVTDDLWDGSLWARTFCGVRLFNPPTVVNPEEELDVCLICEDESRRCDDLAAFLLAQVDT